MEHDDEYVDYSGGNYNPSEPVVTGDESRLELLRRQKEGIIAQLNLFAQKKKAIREEEAEIPKGATEKQRAQILKDHEEDNRFSLIGVEADETKLKKALATVQGQLDAAVKTKPPPVDPKIQISSYGRMEAVRDEEGKIVRDADGFPKYEFTPWTPEQRAAMGLRSGGSGSGGSGSGGSGGVRARPEPNWLDVEKHGLDERKFGFEQLKESAMRQGRAQELSQDWSMAQARMQAQQEQAERAEEMQAAVARDQREWQIAQALLSAGISLSEQMQRGWLQALPYAAIPGQKYFLGFEPGGVSQNIARLSGRGYDPETFRAPIKDFSPGEFISSGLGSVGLR